MVVMVVVVVVVVVARRGREKKLNNRNRDIFHSTSFSRWRYIPTYNR